MSGPFAAIEGREPRITAEPARPRRSALGLLQRIWHIRGSVPIAPRLPRDDALDRLAALLDQPGTTHERQADAIVFAKKDPAAQDKLSVFDTGTLRIEAGPAGPVLRYHLASRILLYCFLAPLMFLAIAQITVAVVKLGGHAVEKKDKAEKPPLPMNPIDKALGAPAPETKKKKDSEGGGRDKKPSPTPAYVFAGIFATLYAAGRWLEARLARRLFGKCLAG